MRRLLGLTLVLIGIAIISHGLYLAIQELGALYDANLNDALNQPEDAEKAAAGRMQKALIRGAIGVPPLIIGGILLRTARRRRRVR